MYGGVGGAKAVAPSPYPIALPCEGSNPSFTRFHTNPHIKTGLLKHFNISTAPFGFLHEIVICSSVGMICADIGTPEALKAVILDFGTSTVVTISSTTLLLTLKTA